MTDQVIQFRGTIYENGYGLIAQKVMRDGSLKPMAKVIYSYLCSFAGPGDDGERTAFPGVALMLKELGIDKKTFYKHRKQLTDKGYITIEKRKSDKHRFERNLYFIEAVPIEKEEEKETEIPKGENFHHGSKGENFHHGKIPPRKNSPTNSTRFLSLIGFKEEEDNTINSFLNEVGKFLDEKDYNIEMILDILNRSRDLNTKYISMVDVYAQYEHMMKKIEVDVIYDHSKYFVEGLKKRANNNKVNSRYATEQRKDLEESQQRKDLYFNWLED